MRKHKKDAPILCVLKLEFNSVKNAKRVSRMIGESKHVVLGSAIVVPITRYNRNRVVSACAACDGYTSNNITDYDLNLVL